MAETLAHAPSADLRAAQPDQTEIRYQALYDLDGRLIACRYARWHYLTMPWVASHIAERYGCGDEDVETEFDSDNLETVMVAGNPVAYLYSRRSER